MSESKNRNYLATFVLDSRGVEASIDELQEKYSKLIQGIEGEVRESEQVGNLDFARPSARGMTSGLFLAYEVTAPASFPGQLQEKVRLDRTVNRVLVQNA